ncbi:4-oxalomesaconate tautomerase [Caulobacter sp. D4A]|uniref:4-oxalomesaconate tautomerase n=1 Tax=unclassified Caulobacter TaxID=2648921 RepID=UPI000D7276B1|nr:MULTISPECIES: 4-oxalomesaconate tautomerase [unclassified Caulobacter]PXA78596.1 4-oxalomesaconate tautomerase [Caulobacter sp. D4A]PXA96746.1 4-oxalomesaconate tautomerase [Caulobacter sp. D5]
MQTAIPCAVLRGGTSKGLYFRAEDLPADEALRDRVLLAAMGSPDERQIDGLGGADSLTSKVAIVSASQRPDADVDYLFLQVSVDEAKVSDRQNCGNILAGIGPYAIEQGLVAAQDGQTPVRIFMRNTEGLATARIETPGGQVNYEGDCRIDGVPGSAAPIPIAFADVAGSSCGALLPTGNVIDVIEGVEATLIDNGMPVVVVRAADLGVTGNETPAELEAYAVLRAKVEAIRLEAGRRMNLGDVTDATVPKITLVSPPTAGGALSTRSFIPHTVHKAIGVFGAVSVATAVCLKGSIAASVASLPDASGEIAVSVEHPTGEFTALLTLSDGGEVVSAALLRTSRLLMTGQVFVPASVWDGRR